MSVGGARLSSMEIDIGGIFGPVLLGTGIVCMAWALILAVGGGSDFAFTTDPYLLPHDDDSEEEAEIRREMRQRSGRSNAQMTGLVGLTLAVVGLVLVLT